MGLFSKKTKIAKNQMPMFILLSSTDLMGKLQNFNDVDDNYAMAVNLGYFLGFFRLQLNGLVSFETADKIINDSISELDNAISGKLSIDNFSYIVKNMYNNSFANIKVAGSDSSNLIEKISQLYLNDLYKENKTDNQKLTIAINNINYMYTNVYNLTSNIKITN